jgi:hypothetical protein
MAQSFKSSITVGEPNWAPLERAVPACELENFMYMGRAGEIELYKHRHTRRYLNIERNAQSFYQYLDGTYVEITRAAERFEVSVTATGSRYAAVVSAPVAFVLSEQGKVRYASRSKPLRDASAWIPPRLDLPEGSLSKKVHAGTSIESRDAVDAGVWFSDWERGGTLSEEVRRLAQWDQTLTLLWFEDEEVPARKFRDERGEIQEEVQSEDDALLKELDGQLHWPTKRRRR